MINDPRRSLLCLSQDLSTPSFRYRVQSVLPLLKSRGWRVQECQLPRGRYGLRLWERRRLLANTHIALLAQFKLSDPEAWLLRRFVPRVVFDVDDALYVRQPRRVGDPPHDSFMRRRKFAATCQYSDCVVAGNGVLAAVARRTARDVVILPTAVDPDRYRASRPDPRRSPTIVWIGRPENLVYLELLHGALARLCARHPGLRLRVVCSRFPAWSDVTIEPVPWSAEAEIGALETADIGIMPLTPDEWSEGKCAFKLLQYMAASLPCVASPVGANREAVCDGVSGLFAADDVQWERALARLIEAPEMRAAFGAAGRARILAHYAMPDYANRYAELLERISQD